MKKNATNAVIKMLGTIAIAVAATFSPAFCQTSSSDADINTYTLSVSADLYAQLRLPKDIRSGDVITGSVIEEKKANAPANNTWRFISTPPWSSPARPRSGAGRA